MYKVTKGGAKEQYLHTRLFNNDRACVCG